MNPILLLHGALGSSSQLEVLENKLIEAGKQVFRLDFSGHSGRDFSHKGFGIEEFAEDILEFVNEHQLPQIDIFGYSMGGYVALWFAHQHPERVGKIVTLGTKFDWNPDSAAKEIRKMNAEKIEEKVPAFARLLQQRHAPNDWKEVLRKTATMMEGLGQQPLLTESIFNALQQPVVILLGDQDDMADLAYSQTVASWIPQAIFELLPNTQHPIEKVNLDFVIHHCK